jgi:predicted nucleic acid-binding protein
MTELRVMISDDLAEQLAAEAAERGTSAENLAADLLRKHVRPSRERSLSFIGMFEGVPGRAERGGTRAPARRRRRRRVRAIVVVDTGPLVAASIRSDPAHERCAAFFETSTEPLVLPQLVLVEAGYFVRKLLGPVAEADFLGELVRGSLDLQPLERNDLIRMAELIETYADLGLGTVDASVIATAERLGVSTIATLDRRHFTVVRPQHVSAFELVP